MSLNHLVSDTICQFMREREKPDMESDSSTFHPALDISFLEMFMAQALSQEQIEEYRAHLAICPICREEMAIHARCGTLTPPDSATRPNSASRNIPSRDTPSTNTAASPNVTCSSSLPTSSKCLKPQSKTRWIRRTMSAVVCGTLCLVGVFYYWNPQSDGQKAALNASTANTSPPKTGALPNETDSMPAEQTFPQTLAAESPFPSEEGSKNILTELDVLLLYEEQPMALTLAALGFRVNGLNPAKYLIQEDPAHKKIAQRYQKALAESPENPTLVLNYAAFLIFSERSPEEADVLLKNIVLESLDQKQRYTVSKLTALSFFLQSRFSEALPHFAKAAEISAESTDKLDWATALYAAGQEEEARALFHDLRNEISDPQILRQIQRLLNL